MEIQSYGQIQEILKTFHVAPNQKLGQNFLLDANILAKIASYVPAGGSVLEIGPGLGSLTHHLAGRAKRVTCVEIDRGLIPVLQETQKDHPNVTLIRGDILHDDVMAQALNSAEAPYTLAANLPYYITTPIIMNFLSCERPPEQMIVMTQKEVAGRISAAPGGKDYGILSVAVQYYAQAKTLFTVKPGSFYPRPKVDSCVLCLTRLPRPAVLVDDPALFFRTVRAAFAMRRKTLQNNLLAAFPELKPSLPAILAVSGIDGKRRGETLSLEEFANLSQNICHELPKNH